MGEKTGAKRDVCNKDKSADDIKEEKRMAVAVSVSLRENVSFADKEARDAETRMSLSCRFPQEHWGAAEQYFKVAL